MDRRTAISRVAIILGSTIIGADLFISGCTNEPAIASQALLSDAQIAYLNEVADTILPKTAASEGAKAANVGAFMKTMVRDCYPPENQALFITGIDQLEQTCKKIQGKGFLACTPQERTQFLVHLDAELKKELVRNNLLQQKEADKEKASQASGKPNYTRKTPPVPYFAMIKQLTLLGYFTSEIGYKSMGYVSVPGRYDGNVTSPA